MKTNIIDIISDFIDVKPFLLKNICFVIQFCFRIWQSRRVVFTKDFVAITKDHDDAIIDKIPLAEVDSVRDMQNTDSEEGNSDKSQFHSALMIKTVPHGHNSGRTYYFQAGSGEECIKLVRDITLWSKTARKREEAISRFKRSQRKVRKMFDSPHFQTLSAMLIIGVSLRLVEIH